MKTSSRGDLEAEEEELVALEGRVEEKELEDDVHRVEQLSRHVKDRHIVSRDESVKMQGRGDALPIALDPSNEGATAVTEGRGLHVEDVDEGGRHGFHSLLSLGDIDNRLCVTGGVDHVLDVET